MIVTTTPTGTIGSQVVDRLIHANEQVRVIVRDPSRLHPTVRDRVEVVPGSHDDPEVVNKAFAGADAVFWLVPADRQAPSAHAAYVDFARPAVEAFVEHGVGHVVGVSALGRGLPVAEHAGYVTATLAMDDLIASRGVNYRALTNPAFMDNTLRSVRAIKTEGRFGSPVAGDRKMPTVATRDIAAAAAGLLLDRDWTGFAEVPLLGPEDLSFNEMAEIISDTLGIPVGYEQTPADSLKDDLLAYGWSEPMAQAMVDMLLAGNNGLNEGVTRTPENTTPTTFRQWCQDVLKPAFDAA
ncbi:NAD(P)H-binding protein [Amycolatopsis pigmentata]|uniref:NAD(P)H-binding protein n=1 Tax=Amycolatopsis pigmentata TaxID=450801 RepID=A0ABW5G4M6_9PSEU